MKRSGLALLLLASAGLGACAWLPKHHHWARARPVETPAAATTESAEDRLYQDAAQAIGARDYATALDLLQAARDNKPDDVRVLNAFGVVYDKLGRFDLATRYYAQARAADPNSQIVQQNIAYSTYLQGKAHGEPATTTLAITVPKLAPSPTSGGLVQVAPGIMRIPAPLDLTTALPVITGHPLTFVDASGQPGAAEPVRRELARRGWSVPKAAETQPRTEPRTQIVFAAPSRQAAEALAKTIGHPVQMTVCNGGCAGVRLELGADSVNWKVSGRRTALRRTV